MIDKNQEGKNYQIHVRVSKSQKSMLKDLAYDHRMTMSEFLLYLIEEQAGKVSKAQDSKRVVTA